MSKINSEIIDLGGGGGGEGSSPPLPHASEQNLKLILAHITSDNFSGKGHQFLYYEKSQNFILLVLTKCVLLA